MFKTDASFSGYLQIRLLSFNSSQRSALKVGEAIAIWKVTQIVPHE